MWILIPIMTMVLMVYFFGCHQSSSELATLKLQILDQSNGKPIRARVLLKAANGKSYYPPDVVQLKIATEVWFMSPGYSQINVPTEKIALRIERGKEKYNTEYKCNLGFASTKRGDRHQRSESKKFPNRWNTEKI